MAEKASLYLHAEDGKKESQMVHQNQVQNQRTCSTIEKTALNREGGEREKTRKKRPHKTTFENFKKQIR